MNFSLNELLVSTYGRFPEVERRPIIGITANYSDIDATVRDRYYKQIISAGGVPVIIPPVADAAIITDTLDKVDGVLLTGGGDYNPLWCGEEPSPKLHNINRERDAAELMLTRLAYNRQIPMLGICRGIQTLAMALGGHVEQDITASPPALPRREGAGSTTALPLIKHSQDADREEATHSVIIEEGSMLFTIYFQNANTQHQAPNTLFVNSFHHQAVAEPGEKFRAVAWASDGVIEAMESVERFGIDTVFFSSSALTLSGMIADFCEDANEMRRKVLQIAETSFFLCDKSKIGKHGLHILAPLKDIDYLITDGQLPDDMTEPGKVITV